MKKKFLTLGVASVLIAGSFVGGFISADRVRNRNNPANVVLGSVPAKPSTPELPAIGSAEELAEAVTLFQRVGGLVLPERLSIVSGSPFAIYLHNVVPVRDPEVFSYEASCAKCDFVTVKRRMIALSPKAGDVGTHSLDIVVRTPAGEVIEKRSIKLVVVPENAGANRAINALMVGDSLGHQSRFPNELARFLEGSRNPKVTFLGTHRPKGAIIPHEQYGGWTYQSFLVNFGLDPKIYHTSASPFLFKDGADKVRFDMKRYVAEKIAGIKPDYIHIQLGTNDCFSLDPSSPSLDQSLNEILANADQLIAGLREALPNAKISIGTVIPANAADRAYAESYKAFPTLHSEWRYRQVQMALARKQMQHYQGREAEKLFVVPTHLGLDATDGYSAHDFVPTGVEYRLSHAVHPTPAGDRQVAAAIYGYLKESLGSTAKN